MFISWLIENMIIEAVEGFKVNENTSKRYDVTFYINGHEVNLLISEHGLKYELSFSVDGSHNIVEIGHASALNIFRAVIKISNDYFINYKSIVNMITFSSDDTPSRLKLYDRLGKQIESNGYVDVSYYDVFNEKQYVFVKPEYSNLYKTDVELDVSNKYIAEVHMLFGMVRIDVEIMLYNKGDALVNIGEQYILNSTNALKTIISTNVAEVIVPQIEKRIDNIDTIMVYVDRNLSDNIDYRYLKNKILHVGYVESKNSSGTPILVRDNIIANGKYETY